jgi:hypothetical protein
MFLVYNVEIYRKKNNIFFNIFAINEFKLNAIDSIFFFF